MKSYISRSSLLILFLGMLLIITSLYVSTMITLAKEKQSVSSSTNMSNSEFTIAYNGMCAPGETLTAIISYTPVQDEPGCGYDVTALAATYYNLSDWIITGISDAPPENTGNGHSPISCYDTSTQIVMWGNSVNCPTLGSLAGSGTGVYVSNDGFTCGGGPPYQESYTTSINFTVPDTVPMCTSGVNMYDCSAFSLNTLVHAENQFIPGQGFAMETFSGPGCNDDITAPTLNTNYDSGAPNSVFTLTGSGFPSNIDTTIVINGQTLGVVPANTTGEFLFLLSTANADEGAYFVTASANPTATTSFILNSTNPVRPQEDNGPVFDVPEGIAFTDFIFLPSILRD